MSIFHIVRENWPYPPTASGSYSRQAGGQAGGQMGRQAGGRAGRQASRQADKIQVSFDFFKFSTC